MSDPEETKAAEIVAGWAGLGAGKREIMAAMFLTAPCKDAWGQPSSEFMEMARRATADPSEVESTIKKSLSWADVIIKLSKDNPPEC